MDAGLAWRYRRMQVVHMAKRGLAVHGDGGWLEEVGERWKGPLLNGTDMTRAYREAALNLDVPRLHQREIATLRAFDVLASGGLLVAESGTELEELFQPGVEFLAWRTPEERDEWLDAALAGGGARMDGIAEAGREAAWSHRLDVRVHRILEAVDEIG
jgi:spore maturation protein CgeB